MTHLACKIAYAGQKLFLSSVMMVLSIGRSFITPWMDVSTASPTTTWIIVPSARRIFMDRDELIDRVTELTSGNRNDYLTRGDVSQIIDATLQVMQGESDAEPPAEPAAPEQAS